MVIVDSSKLSREQAVGEAPWPSENYLPPPPYNAHVQGSGTSSLNTPSLSDTSVVRSTEHLEANARSGHTLPETLGPTPRASLNPVKTKRWLPDRRKLTILALIALAVVGLAIILPVYFAILKPRRGKWDSTSTSVTGNESIVVMQDGTSFVYSNPFGGYLVDNPDNLYDTSARPNSWTPPLNTSWDYEQNRIQGVNLAGLFVLEPFISPALFQKYPGAVDEWTLSVEMAKDMGSGGLGQLEDHYKTFITEKDIADIASAGLTWVRLPIGFWAIETFPDEPFLAKTSWSYIIRIFQWCRKYGIRVNLVLNAVPGSQNGLNHSGKIGSVNFLAGGMGIANAQRTLYYIRLLAEFVSQPEWINVVPMLSILNEPLIAGIGVDQLRSFYLEAYQTIRGTTGYGIGKGPYIAVQAGSVFDGFMHGTDRVVLERQFRDAFNATPVTAIASGTMRQACSLVGRPMNQSRSDFGITVASGLSGAFVKCGLFISGVADSSASNGGECTDWNDSSVWGLGIKSTLTQFIAGQMDATRDFFFYTWKIGSSAKGVVEAPLWSYQLGLQRGWIYEDPRKSIGVCQTLIDLLGVAWNGSYTPWDEGGATVASEAARYPWPPPALSRMATTINAVMPTYASSGAPVSLPAPRFTDSTGKVSIISHGSLAARIPAPTYHTGCKYGDAWNSSTLTFVQSHASCGITATQAAETATSPSYV